MDLLPSRARSLMAFPMSLFGDDVSQVERMAADFAESRRKLPEGISILEGCMDTFLLDSGNLRKPGGTGMRLIGTSAQALQKECGKLA